MNTTPAEYEALDKLAEQEAELSATDEVNELPPSDIIAFNELRSCFDLVRLYETASLTSNRIFNVRWFGNPLHRRGLSTL